MMAWVFVWQFMFSGTLEIATSSIGMAEYTGFLWPKLVTYRWGVKLLAGAITGGYVGAYLAQKMNPQHVRWTIIVIGLGLSAYFFVKH